jgi:Zn-dependent M28 family amino/carboxypeptidase
MAEAMTYRAVPLRKSCMVLLLAILLAPVACRSKKTPQAVESDLTVAAAALPAANPPTDKSTKAPQIDSARAMKYVREIVGFGPRPVGSEAHKRTESYIISHLKSAGAQIESDAFDAQTPVGAMAMRSIIGKFPGKKDGLIVIASHYDTLYGRKDFVGANDSGSSSGLLLELANQLGAQKQRSGYSVWLVFTDGEEAIKNWSATDSDYGSRHLAEKWQVEGTLKKIKAFLLLDMIGDADLNIDRNASSTSWLEDLVYKAAGDVGYQSYFFAREVGMDDDHTPFLKLGVPCADVIDYDYGYNNVFWHTPQDSLDKLSPHSLQVVGDVVMRAVELLDQR